MSLNIKDIPQGGGGWFKPADHQNAHAILVELKGFDRQRPTPNGPKDSALTDITIFDTEAALDALEPSTVLKGCRVEQTVLARDLNEQVGVGGATIVTLAQSKPSKPGQRPAWVWRTASNDVKHKVIAYADKREADMQAALAAVPDFE